MTAELATIDGFTRQQAHENYMHALAQLVVFVFAGIGLELIMRPDYDAYLYNRHRVPTPEGWRAVVGFQAQEHCRQHPPYLRTIELVSG